MRQYLGRTFLACILACLFLTVACDKDDTILYGESTYGDIVNGEFLSDQGFTYIIKEQVCEGDITQVQRAYITCDILKKISDKKYEIRLLSFTAPLVKDPLFRSEMTEEQTLDLGEDGIILNDAWTSRKYLNLRLVFPFIANAGVTHRIWLVSEDSEPAQDTLRLTLCHNAYGDTLKYTDEGETSTNEGEISWGISAVCFPIDGCLPSGKTSMPIKLTYRTFTVENNDYTPRTREDSRTGVFKK